MSLRIVAAVALFFGLCDFFLVGRVLWLEYRVEKLEDLWDASVTKCKNFLPSDQEA